MTMAMALEQGRELKFLGHNFFFPDGKLTQGKWKKGGGKEENGRNEEEKERGAPREGREGSEREGRGAERAGRRYRNRAPEVPQLSSVQPSAAQHNYE